LNHAADLVLGNFRKYNYLPEENLRKYGTPEAPLFDVSRIEVPTYIVYSSQDWATPEAVKPFSVTKISELKNALF